MNNSAGAIAVANMTFLFTIGSIYQHLSRSETRRHIRKCQGHPVEWEYGRMEWTSSMTLFVEFSLSFRFVGYWLGRCDVGVSTWDGGLARPRWG